MATNFCPNCGNATPANLRFCTRCGATLSLRCTKCETELAPDAMFCGNCGQRVTSTAPPSATAPPKAGGSSKAPIVIAAVLLAAAAAVVAAVFLVLMPAREDENVVVSGGSPASTASPAAAASPGAGPTRSAGTATAPGSTAVAGLQALFTRATPRVPSGLPTGADAALAGGPDRTLTRVVGEAFRKEGLDNQIGVAVWPVAGTETSLLVLDMDSAYSQRLNRQQSEAQANAIFRASAQPVVRVARIERIVFIIRDFPQARQTAMFTVTLAFLERLSRGQPTEAELRQNVTFTVTR